MAAPPEPAECFKLLEAAHKAAPAATFEAATNWSAAEWAALKARLADAAAALAVYREAQHRARVRALVGSEVRVDSYPSGRSHLAQLLAYDEGRDTVTLYHKGHGDVRVCSRRPCAFRSRQERYSYVEEEEGGSTLFALNWYAPPALPL